MTAWAVLAAAATMGLLGSLHCSAMCGPLAAAGTSGSSRARDIAGYLGGRFVAYATVGAVLGQLGQHALCRLPMHTAETLAVVLTAVPAGVHGLRLLFRRAPRERLTPLRTRRASGLLQLLASLMPRRGLALGLATALLPCGLLWSAWALAAATARPGSARSPWRRSPCARCPGSWCPSSEPTSCAAVSARRCVPRDTG